MGRMSLYEPFNEVFPELLRGFMAPASTEKQDQLIIRVDMSESEKEYLVTAELPGVNKDDIKIDIDKNKLSISAEVKKETEEKDNGRVLRKERFYGSASRSFVFDTDIDESAASAKVDNGVLKVVLPKSASSVAKRLVVS